MVGPVSEQEINVNTMALGNLRKPLVVPPDIDGMGYRTDHVKNGAGLSLTRYASKTMDNGAVVVLRQHFPSPFDLKAKGLSECYSVWVGMTDKGEDLPCPFQIPGAATSFAPDGEVNWFAVFGEDGEAAEAFALTLQTDRFAAPFVIELSELPRYYNNASENGLLDQAVAHARRRRLTLV